VLRARLRFCLIALAWLAARAASAQQESRPATAEPTGIQPTVTVGGLLQMQAEAGDQGDSRFSDGNGRLYLRRARLNASGSLLKDFDYRLEVDLAGGLARSSSLRAQMTDGYVTWNRLPAANVRAGQFKTPFGFEQLYGDPRLLTIERSLANDRLTLNRQIGVQVGGSLFDKDVTYAMGAFNGNGANNNFNDNNHFLWAGRLTGVLWQRAGGDRLLRWSAGGGAFTSDDTALSEDDEFRFDSTPATPEPDNLFTGRRTGFGLDTQLQAGRLEIWIEGLAVRWEPGSRQPRSRLDSQGWYVQASWYFLPQRLQAVAKLESFDPDADAEGDETSTATLGVNWYLNDHDLKLMADYLWLDLRVDAAGRRQRENKVLARFQVVF
jgi:phosphate-selective porin OprO and OprP